MLTIVIPHCNRSVILRHTLRLNKKTFEQRRDVRLLVSENSSSQSEREAAFKICNAEAVEIIATPFHLSMVAHWNWLFDHVKDGFVALIPERRFATEYLCSALDYVYVRNYSCLSYSHNSLVFDAHSLRCSKEWSFKTQVIGCQQARKMIGPSFPEILPQLYNTIISVDKLNSFRSRSSGLEIVRGISPDINFATRYVFDIEGLSSFFGSQFAYYDAPCVASLSHPQVLSNGQFGDSKKHIESQGVFAFEPFPCGFFNPTGLIMGELIYELGMKKIVDLGLHYSCLPFLIMEVKYSKTRHALEKNFLAAAKYGQLLRSETSTSFLRDLELAKTCALQRLDSSSNSLDPLIQLEVIAGDEEVDFPEPEVLCHSIIGFLREYRRNASS